MPFKEAGVDDVGAGNDIRIDCTQGPHVVVVDDPEIDQVMELDRQVVQEIIEVDDRSRADEAAGSRDLAEQGNGLSGHVRRQQLVDRHLGRPDQALTGQVAQVCQAGLDEPDDIQLIQAKVGQIDQGVADQLAQIDKPRADQGAQIIEIIVRQIVDIDQGFGDQLGDIGDP